jgi:hypothetical protein
MKITLAWLKKNHACPSGIDWFLAQSKTDGIKLINALYKDSHFDWAIWLLVRLMNRKQQIALSIFAARSVLPIFEKRYPKDDRPILAIEAAEAYLLHNTKENSKNTLTAAATAADVAADAFADYVNYTTNFAVRSAAYAVAHASACAAYDVDNTHRTYAASITHAAYNAVYTARVAADAYASNRVKNKNKINTLNFGLALIKHRSKKSSTSISKRRGPK